MAYLSGYFDLFERDVDKQLEIAKALDIKFISLRYFGQKTLKDLDFSEIKTIQAMLKKYKMELNMVDANYTYQLDNPDFEDLANIFDKAHQLQTTVLILKLPNSTQLEENYPAFLEHVNQLFEMTKKKSFNLVFSVNETYKVGVIAYLINQLKSCNFIFDAGSIKKMNASVTTSYRIMKKTVVGVMIADQDKHFEPELLGYGHTGITDIMKKLNRDKYKGALIIDLDLKDYILHRHEAYQKKRFFGLFSKTKQQEKKYMRMDAILGLKAEDKLNYLDLLKMQVSIIDQFIEKK